MENSLHFIYLILTYKKYNNGEIIITRLQEDNLIERRIRLAIREKTPIAKWLKMLSKQTKQKDEWLYWQAKLLQQEGKITNPTLFLNLFNKTWDSIQC